MKRTTAEQRLYALWAECRDLQATEDLLHWDQETYMPERGHTGRGKLMATVAGLKHRCLTSPELQEALRTCAETAAEGSLLAAQIRCARYEVDRAVRIPEKLAREIAEAKTAGLVAWERARAAADFAQFHQPLQRLVRLRREEAAAIAPDGNAYDALLDYWEPGATEAELQPLFARLREELSPLVQTVVSSGVEVDESPVRGRFPGDRQLALGRRAAAAIGFDFAAGRLDPSTHPFCIGAHPDDVRLTYRFQEDDFRPSLFGILHEAGHGLYEQGLAAEWQRTPIGDAVSMVVHESQSRLWENHVGRSRGFWRWALPHYRDAFPDAPQVDVDSLWPALHTVKPSLIRVEADEATYNLHIVVRFEIERDLIAGRIEVGDLPEVWNDRYEELVGIRPPDAAAGVLQDIHWGQGSFGYFPTYTLGNLAAAQLFAAAGRELGDLEAAFAEGEFGPLLDWLRTRIHHPGGRYTASELIARTTGKALAPDDLLDHLRQTTEQAYQRSSRQNPSHTRGG
ncbi:MAG: carboxypeptidase M32 [bacterium]|nr:carboxypeptidase M32 [bacterium]